MKRSVVTTALALVTMVGGAWGLGTGSPAQAVSDAAPPAARATGSAVRAAAVQPVSLRLEPLGASFTYGSHSSAGNGYRGPLWDDLTGEGYRLDFVGPVRHGTMADPDNEGHPGLRIDQVAGLTDASLAAYKPNVVTLVVGTNDLVQNYQVPTAPDRLSALIDRILADDPGVTLLVGNLIPSALPDVQAATPKYNAGIASVVQSKQTAGKHVGFVDMSAVTLSDIGPDGIHPGDAGYQKMGDAWNKGVQAASAAGWITAPVSLGAPAAGATGQITSGITGKCADIAASGTADGTAVQLYGCNHTTAQSWSVYTDGSLRALGKCLDATGGGTADGTTVQLYTCNNTGAQIWQAYKGRYLNLASGKCLDVTGGSAADGTRLELWGCNTTAAQQWSTPGVGPVTTGFAGKCLDVKAGSNVNGTKAEIWDCNATPAQNWVVRDGQLQGSGLCLDVIGAGTANGTLVDQWDCNGTANQVWKAGPNSSLVNPVSGRCLDVPAATTANGTQLEIWDCNGGTNQRFALPAS
ncbi:ricin-type beta-trefoil lectin domain protein [Streptomyces sp. NBC_01477]|uniref:ricin-type beta-trefoil lectin domain protein n=1 Tax=Streptomyces sp. NBC_01477 TaxID=2976015 RepID=UPI002E318139|nr:ricin-type beta-trefoil lectin domain protein [Streptomyces sp. NBC_01477]